MKKVLVGVIAIVVIAAICVGVYLVINGSKEADVSA